MLWLTRPGSRSRDNVRRRRYLELLLGLLALITMVQVAQAAPPELFSEAGPGEEGFERTDLYGDSLPAGAVTRMGTLRMWMAGQIWSFSFAADGKTLAAASADERSDGVPIWEADTGRLVRLLPTPAELLPEDFSAMAVAFSPDRRSLAAASSNTIVIWQKSTGRVFHMLRGHDGGISNLAFAAGGETLASTGGDRTLRIWNLRTGKEVRTFSNLGNVLQFPALSPDGAVLAAGLNGDTVRLWDVITGNVIRQFPAPESTCSLAFGPEDNTISSLARDGTLYVWDSATGNERRRIRLRPWGLAPFAPVFHSPDRKMIAALDGGHILGIGDTIRIWDVATGGEVRGIQLDSLKGMHGVAFSPVGKTIASTSGNGQILQLWDITTGKEKLSYPRHQGPVYAIAFAPNDKTIASGGDDGTLRLWDVATGKEVRRIVDSPPRRWKAETDEEIRQNLLGRVKSLAFAPDGETIVSMTHGGALRFWDVGSGKGARRIDLVRSSPISAVAFATDCKTIAVASDDSDIIEFWDVVTGKEIRRGSTGHLGRILSVALGTDGKTFASAGFDRTVRLWETNSFRRLRQTTTSHDSIHCVAYSPDGKMICIGGADAVLCLWNLDTGEFQRSSEPGDPDEHIIQSVEFSPDGNWVAWGGDDQVVRIWDVRKGRETRRFEGHRGGIYDLAFSRNSNHVASASGDGTILVWDIAQLTE